MSFCTVLMGGIFPCVIMYCVQILYSAISFSFPVDSNILVPCSVNSYNRPTVKWLKDGLDLVQTSRAVVWINRRIDR